ncbi:unnamed protein product [Didymodactylos carnosus]|uniref:Alpha/beta hydrolase fold-3 domain-containing protein n=1 Tax=Didymodactylos carnosus TaxID=1234261 RepID=A0A815W4A3_9BILA|nr:unnamed protein product [Didymodactylos carnosus]CAF1543143.1 unnamed protein product [Didymodactylos carnosus]CAF4067325.1 unnamed protein product [Didymodactylos carnosus]CAF4403639.1 unnamed protein product [Didymodactylos carnosus]
MIENDLRCTSVVNIFTPQEKKFTWLGTDELLGLFKRLCTIPTFIEAADFSSPGFLEYRLLPENSFPNIIQDALTLYQALLNERKRLIGIGDSAGGGLWLLTVQTLIREQIPPPRAIVVFSPWADLTQSGQSYRNNQHSDLMLTIATANWLKQQIIDNDGNKSFPLFGSFKNFPSLYICVGGAELLESDSRLVYARAKEENVDVQLDVGEHLSHIYPIFYSYYPESKQALTRILDWLHKKLLNDKTNTYSANYTTLHE